MKIKCCFVEVETLDEYLDVCKHLMYYREICGAEKERNIWTITEYVLKPEDLHRWEVKKMFKRRPDILKMARYHVGDICKTTHGVIGIFRGIMVTDEDYYWMVEDFEKVEHNMHIITCVEGCTAYNTFKLWPEDDNVRLNERMRIMLKEGQKRVSGRTVRKNGVIFFQDDAGMCYPTSTIAAYCYTPKQNQHVTKHKIHSRG